MEKEIVFYNNEKIQIYKLGCKGLTMVLLHGAGIDSAMLSWKEVMEELSKKHTVYAVDLLGYGESAKPNNMCGGKFYENHVKAMEAVIKHLNLKQFVLSGISMGGAIALSYALEHPQQIQALIPVDSWGIVSKMPCHALYYWIVKTSLTKTAYQWMKKYRWMIKWSIAYSLFGEKAKITDNLVNTLFESCQIENMGNSMDDYQKSSITKSSVNPNLTGRLKELNMPILFINGEKDSFVRVKDAAWASKEVKKGQIHIMKGCKHWPQKERPEEYAQVVCEFLDTYV